MLTADTCVSLKRGCLSTNWWLYVFTGKSQTDDPHDEGDSYCSEELRDKRLGTPSNDTHAVDHVTPCKSSDDPYSPTLSLNEIRQENMVTTIARITNVH